MSLSRTALTLLEVVAALALLATLLASVLAAQNRLAAQTRRAEARLTAIDAADRLLAEWTATTPMTIPAARGEIPGRPLLYWQVNAKPEPSLARLGIQIARLTISDQRHADGEIPLTAVEFLTTAAIPRGTAP